jgi:hypothetical protein
MVSPVQNVVPNVRVKPTTGAGPSIIVIEPVVLKQPAALYIRAYTLLLLTSVVLVKVSLVEEACIDTPTALKNS